MERLQGPLPASLGEDLAWIVLHAPYLIERSWLQGQGGGAAIWEAPSRSIRSHCFCGDKEGGDRGGWIVEADARINLGCDGVLLFFFGSNRVVIFVGRNALSIFFETRRGKGPQRQDLGSSESV